MNRFLHWALLIAVALVGAACSGEPDAPEGVTVETVALEAPAETPGYVPTLEGPLRILSATPSGTLRSMGDRQPITVTFSQPMVPLGEAPAPPADVLTTDPLLTGSLRWEGTQTLVFRPDSTLPPATPFTVTLRPTLDSPEGASLDAPFAWTFETPRPQLVRSAPDRNARFVDPQQNIFLHFNQRVGAEAARDYLALRRTTSQGRTEPIPFGATNDGDSTLVLTPVDGLAPDTDYEVFLQAGLPSAQGPLGLAEPTVVPFRTYGPPQLTEVTQPRRYDTRQPFDPERGVTLTFSTPVRFDSLRQAVSFAPSVEWPPGVEARDANVSTSHTLPVTLAPETRYTLTIQNLTDRFGQTLRQVQTAFQTRAFEPSFSMKRGLMVLEAGQRAAVPVRAVNVDAVQVGMERLAPDAIVPALRTYDESHYYGRAAPGQPEREPVAADRTVDLGLERNRPGVTTLPLDAALADSTGVVGLRVLPPREVGRGQADLRAIAQVTRLGVTGKFSPHQNLIVVTDLATAAPVAGATVTIRDASNAVQWTGTTDAEGRAQTPGWAQLGLASPDRWRAPVQYAIVEHEGDVAFTSSLFNEGLEPYRFDVNYDWNPQPRTQAGSVFTDRGLYKAGETVHLKSILRTRTDADWQPIRDSVRVLIRDPRDELVLDRPFVPSDLGTFDTEWTAPSDAAQGSYTVRVGLTSDTTLTAERSWERDGIATGTFQIESFRRATFAVDAQTAADSYVAGDFFEGTISARYLFGAGMEGQPVRYQLEQRPGSYDPPGFDGYRFGPLDAYVYEMLARGDTVLDGNSTASLRTQLPGNEDGAVTTLNFSGTVTSPARQTTSARTEVTLHPGLFYVGLKPSTTFLDLSQTKTLTVDAMTIDPNGASVGGKSVTVELVREEWNSVREVGADGRLRWRSERTETVVARQAITTERGSATRLRMPVEQGGRYLVRATGRDVRGNTIRSETYLYASGPGYVAWRREDDDRIELVPERTRYAPGETARLMVQSPYEEATALITVEREGILSSRVTTLTGSTPQIEIPLTEEHLPNAFVSVMLWTGRTAAPDASGDPGAPGFKIGVASLRVDAGRRHLQVEVTPNQQEYRPGEEVAVDLQLRDATGNGVPGEIAFSAADAGVLNLIGYRLPDPFDTFYGPRPLGVTTTESRANLIEQRSFGQKAEDLGGGGGNPDFMLRTDFRPLAHWAPALRTDSDGSAQVTFRLPESLTTFRLMATALTADHTFGAASTDITVTQPLVMTPALPRFARMGDTFSAGVLVSNRTGSDGTATVTAEANGLTLDGPASQTVALPAGATQEVRFDWAAPRPDTAAVTFRATLAEEQDALETTLPIQRPATKQVSATLASTDEQAQQALRLPADRVADLGSFEARLASTALVGLDGALPYLFDYPYGCIEQRTSRIRPVFIARDVLDAFDLTVPGFDPQQAAQEWMTALDDYWTGDGFAMWAGGTRANPYVSAYVVLALAEAEAAGYDVPAITGDAVEALERWVRNRSDRPDFYDSDVWTETRAFMLYALARHDRVLESEIDALASDPPESAEALSHLLRTVTLANATALNRYQAPLAEQLRQRIRVEGTAAYLTVPENDRTGWIFSSTTRATAFGLTALIEANATDDFQPVAQRMVRYLMNQRQAGHWASTQENAAVVDAFRAYFDAYETAAPDFTAEVQLAGRQILQEAFQQRTLRTANATVSAADLPSGETLPVDIIASGTGTATYSLRLTTFTTAPQPARSQGLSVERTLQPLNERGAPTGDPMATGDRTITLQSGDLVRVTLRLTSPADRNYVAVDDALPAGLEAVNAAFATAEQDVLQEAEAGQDRWWGSFNHTELRDDRVLLFADYLRQGEHAYTYVARATTPGTFGHPPATAEEMYRPETRGQTATGTLVVEPPVEGTASASIR
jgi:hypothetical protein